MKLWPYALIPLMLIACGSSPDGEVGGKLPDVRLEAFGSAGQFVPLSSTKGKVLVLEFWATWCGPCKEAMPHMAAMYEELKSKGLQVWGVTSEERSVVTKFFGSGAVPYPMYLDGDQSVDKAFRVEALPTAVVVDREGRIVFKGHPEDPEMRIAVDATLGSG